VTGFRDIQSAILGRIQSGDWPPGSLLPGEVELAGEFGVARATVSRAMRALMDEGLIERRRKAGTRVRAAPMRQARFEMLLVRVEVEAMGAPYGYFRLLREIVAAPVWLQSRLGLVSADVVHLRCLHMAGETPFQVEDRWINPAVVPQVLQEDFTTIGPNEWLVREVPFTDVQVTFSANGATGWVAERLRLPQGEPVFSSERITWLAGVPVTFARMQFGRGYQMTTAHHMG
jgi:GntR family histidine utilization transcriptional repressor